MEKKREREREGDREAKRGREGGERERKIERRLRIIICALPCPAIGNWGKDIAISHNKLSSAEDQPWIDKDFLTCMTRIALRWGTVLRPGN